MRRSCQGIVDLAEHSLDKDVRSHIGSCPVCSAYTRSSLFVRIRVLSVGYQSNTRRHPRSFYTVYGLHTVLKYPVLMNCVNATSAWTRLTFWFSSLHLLHRVFTTFGPRAICTHSSDLVLHRLQGRSSSHFLLSLRIGYQYCLEISRVLPTVCRQDRQASLCLWI